MRLNRQAGESVQRVLRNVRVAQRELQRPIGRLASGRRVNSGADDAAGLAVGRRLAAQVRSLNQSRRNAEDSLSLIQTAEGGLAESEELLVRARELAVQAASDTYSSSERAILHREFTALMDELEDSLGRAEFNGFKLLDGSFTGREILMGGHGDTDGEAIDLSISDMRSSAIGTESTNTVTTPGSAVVTSSQDVGGNPTAAGDVLVNGATIAASVAGDDLVSTRDNDASAIAKAAAINKSTATHGVTATAQATTFVAPGAVTGGNLQNAALFINGVNIGAVAGVLANDAGGQLEAAIDAQSGATGVTASVSGGVLTLTAADGRNIEVDIKKNGSLTGINNGNNQMAYGRIQLSSVSDITVAGTAPLARIGIGPGTTTSTATSITTTTVDAVGDQSLRTKSDANDALAVIDDALDQITSQRGELGALANRIHHGVRDLSSRAGALDQARGRIEDADFARETAQLASADVRRQAAVSLLAQGELEARRVLELISLSRGSSGF